jgi:hypothetical protein
MFSEITKLIFYSICRITKKVAHYMAEIASEDEVCNDFEVDHLLNVFNIFINVFLFFSERI